MVVVARTVVRCVLGFHLQIAGLGLFATGIGNDLKDNSENVIKKHHGPLGGLQNRNRIGRSEPGKERLREELGNSQDERRASLGGKVEVRLDLGFVGPTS